MDSLEFYRHLDHDTHPNLIDTNLQFKSIMEGDMRVWPFLKP